MADSKISALPASTTPLAGTEVLPIVQSSTTRQVSVANLTAGRAISATQLTLTTGNLIVANGQGVDFSATPGTGTSELFDDYEKGTWTPTVTPATGALTAYTSTGYYTKIGNIVTVQAQFVITTAGTAAGTATIGAMPFTSGGLSGSAGTGIALEYWNTGLSYSVTQVPSSTNATVLTAAAGGISWIGGNRYAFTLTYMV